jgi:FkbM family methyltransferase
MLLSKLVPTLGRVHYPLGGGGQFADLITEIDEYFQHGITLVPGDVVFDVGANIGAFALHASRRAGGGLELFCFEPIPPVYAALERNLADNPVLGAAKKHLYQAGLTSMGGPSRATFHYFKRLPCDTTLHIDEKREEFAAFFQAKGQKLDEQMRRVPGGVGRVVGGLTKRSVSGIATSPLTRAALDRALGLTKLDCPLTSIDAIVAADRVDRIDLLKVDVEGAELDVLLGIGPTTWPKIKQVVMEGHDKGGRLDRIKGLLIAAGFSFIRSEVPPLAIERGLNNFILHARRS